GIVIVLIMTLWQVTAPSSMLGMGLQPDVKHADNMALNLGIRLFAWILTGVLIYLLMYGKSDKAVRSASTRTTGLAFSLLNFVAWTGITFWYFKYIHGT